MEFCRDWPIRRRLVVVAADRISDKLEGMVALVKQVRDVSDLISEYEGANAVARDSLVQDNIMLSYPSPCPCCSSAWLSLSFLSWLLSRLGNEARPGDGRRLRSLR